MRLASVRLAGRHTWGVVTDDGFRDLGGDDARFGSLRDYIESGSPADIDGVTSTESSLDEIEFLPVVPEPRQIFCVGANYEGHRKEIGHEERSYPTIFLRLAGSQIGHGSPLIKPRESDRFDYEGELAVVIGRGGRRIAAEDAWDHVFGYACYNDGSIRDWQNHTPQWAPGKNFVGTGGFGPYLVSADECADITDAYLVTYVNGDERQRAQIGEMTYSIPTVIEYLSTFANLLPGDVICTGTPGGIGSRRNPPAFLVDGDVVEVSIDGVGTLRNPVIAEAG